MQGLADFVIEYWKWNAAPIDDSATRSNALAAGKPLIPIV
jgi:hypothetical protein